MAELILSAFTAFIISGGGALGVVAGSGYTVNKQAVIGACILGAIAAAKDIRSQLKLPPITNGTGDTTIIQKSTVVKTSAPPTDTTK